MCVAQRWSSVGWKMLCGDNKWTELWCASDKVAGAYCEMKRCVQVKNLRGGEKVGKTGCLKLGKQAVVRMKNIVFFI